MDNTMKEHKDISLPKDTVFPAWLKDYNKVTLKCLFFHMSHIHAGNKLAAVMVPSMSNKLQGRFHQAPGDLQAVYYLHAHQQDLASGAPSQAEASRVCVTGEGGGADQGYRAEARGIQSAVGFPQDPAQLVASHAQCQIQGPVFEARWRQHRPGSVQGLAC